MGIKVYHRDIGSRDGVIANIASGDLGNANTAYTYIDLIYDAYKHLSLEHVISNTTLTIEACNVGTPDPIGSTLLGVATATDGTGAVLTDSALSTPFPTNTDLNQIQVRIVEDATTPANVGLTRTVKSYTGGTGAMTLSSAFGAITSGVTKYRLEDNPIKWGRRVSDPTSSQWIDVTLILTGLASHTVSGIWFFDTQILMDRFRVKRVTTNATNSCVLRLSRGR